MPPLKEVILANAPPRARRRLGREDRRIEDKDPRSTTHARNARTKQQRVLCFAVVLSSVTPPVQKRNLSSKSFTDATFFLSPVGPAVSAKQSLSDPVLGTGESVVHVALLVLASRPQRTSIISRAGRRSWYDSRKISIYYISLVRSSTVATKAECGRVILCR